MKKKFYFLAKFIITALVFIVVAMINNTGMKTREIQMANMIKYYSAINANNLPCDFIAEQTIFNKSPTVITLVKEPEISEDVILLAKTICAEAGYNNEQDMFLVGNVVMNRLESPWCPNAETISDVIYQKGQYACAWNGKLDSIKPNELAIDIAMRLIDGERVAPKNVIFQSQTKLGDGVWKKVGVHYYCYKNDPT